MPSLRDQIIEQLTPLFEDERAEFHQAVIQGGGTQDQARKKGETVQRKLAAVEADAILKLIEPRGESELREALDEIADKHWAAIKKLSLMEGRTTFREADAKADKEVFRARQALATPSAPVSAPDLVRLVFDWEQYDTTKDAENLELCREAGWVHPTDPPDEWEFQDCEQEYFSLTKSGQKELDRLKSALASRDEWRPISEYDKTPDNLGLTTTVILGFAPDEIGETLPSTEGYWRQDEWRGCPPCFVSSIDPDTPHMPAQPTHFKPLPTPPTSQEETET